MFHPQSHVLMTGVSCGRARRRRRFHPDRAHGGAADPGHFARDRHPDLPRCDEVGERPGGAVQPQHRLRQCQGALPANSQSYAGSATLVTALIRLSRACRSSRAAPRSPTHGTLRESTVSVTTSSRRQRTGPGRLAKGTGNCWYIVDNTQAERSPQRMHGADVRCAGHAPVHGDRDGFPLPGRYLVRRVEEHHGARQLTCDATTAPTVAGGTNRVLPVHRWIPERCRRTTCPRGASSFAALSDRKQRCPLSRGGGTLLSGMASIDPQMHHGDDAERTVWP